MSSENRQYLLEQIDDAAVVQLYADGFSALPTEQKILVWHLTQAALAGRDIYYDQRYRHSLEMRTILETILRAARQDPSAFDSDTLTEIRRYTKLFWLNSGPYNNLTARKFVLKCAMDALVAAAEQAHGVIANDPGSYRARIERLASAFFDVSSEPLVTNKTPEPGGDILRDSANNLYVGVSLADLEGFREAYGLNSRLIKTASGLVEVVAHARPNGLYEERIASICSHLKAALPFATPAMKRALEALITFYYSGEESDRVAYDIAWVEDKDSPVDTINGFIETYMDARGVKGAWEALVFYVNADKTRGIQNLAESAQWFEDRMPWDARWRRTAVNGVTARAVEVVMETGDSGPMTPIGINLPNDQLIREQHGSKSVTIANVTEAYDKSLPKAFREEFCWSAEEVERAEQWSSLASEVTTGIHEVLGHGSGVVEAHLDGRPELAIKEHYAALEESRADLVALYFVGDPKIAELGMLPAEHQETIVQAEYEGYARNALVQLRRVREGTQLEEDHMRNRQMIVHWLMAHTSAIEVRKRDGKTYYVMVDPKAFHDGVGRLLGEVQRIKSTGDYAAAKAMFETYGIHFDAALRDEIVTRVDRLNLPSYTGFVQPELTAVRNEAGEIVDVTISYPLSLENQMLGWSHK
jgi:dipeptidyl-peptidase III